MVVMFCVHPNDLTLKIPTILRGWRIFSLPWALRRFIIQAGLNVVASHRDDEQRRIFRYVRQCITGCDRTRCRCCCHWMSALSPESRFLSTGNRVIAEEKPIHSHFALTTTGGFGIGLHTHTVGNGHPHRLHPQNKPDPFRLAFGCSLNGEK